MDMETLDVFFSNTTPQFYVILTGTSTIISGVVLVRQFHLYINCYMVLKVALFNVRTAVKQLMILHSFSFDLANYTINDITH